jgi:UDP-glucuronate 4-epimerase
MTILLTGGAGFIGSNLAETLLKDGHEVHCIDNLDPFYDPVAKLLNLQWCREQPAFHFHELDIRTTQAAELTYRFRKITFDAIFHLAAKAGVRPSIENAHDYYQTNVMGTLNLLEFARINRIRKFVFASSSSVYGNNPRVPWSEDDFDLKPISPYAASKLAAEDMGQVYSLLCDYSRCLVRASGPISPSINSTSKLPKANPSPCLEMEKPGATTPMSLTL